MLNAIKENKKLNKFLFKVKNDMIKNSHNSKSDKSQLEYSRSVKEIYTNPNNNFKIRPKTSEKNKNPLD